MKKIKKIVCMLLCGLLVFGFSAACSRETLKIDETKTQLFISNFDAGIGQSWLNATIDAFSEDMKDYSFEEGRKGVQIIVENSQQDTGATLIQNIPTTQNNLFFTENIDYKYMTSLGGLMYDVTDIMNSGAITGVDSNGQFTRETETIKSKIDSNFLAFLNTSKTSEAYYSIPFYFAYKGLIYDRDLWNEKSFYLAKDGCPSEHIVQALENNTDIDEAKKLYNEAVKSDFSNPKVYLTVDASGYNKTYDMQMGLSAGPDGKYGTFDDGLPATAEEFYDLMDYMVSNNITPLIWTGKNPGYADNLTTAYWQNDAGVDELKAFYSLNGEATLVKLNENGKIVKDANGNVVTEKMTFNDQNRAEGYNIQRMVSKYNALKFIGKITDKENIDAWTDPAGFNETSQIAAQSKYLQSVESNKRIAMLMDGAWWQQESTTTFEVMAKKDVKYSKENRDFAILSLPNSSVDRLITRRENNEGNVIVSQNNSYCFINGRTTGPQLEAAKAFLSYMNSEKMLLVFSKNTNMTRPVALRNTDDSAISGLSKYAKNIVKLIDASKVVYPYSTNEFIHRNSSFFNNSNQQWLWHTYNRNIGEYFNPFSTLSNSVLVGQGMNAEIYFEGLYTHYSTHWRNLTGIN